MAYKCVFSDIDGTLLNSKHQISEKTKKKVQQLAIQNIPFVLVSARMPKGMHYFLDELQIKAPMNLSLYVAEKDINKSNFEIYHVNPEEAINDIESTDEHICRINIKKGMPLIFLTNTVYYDNYNKTLPEGMELNDLVLLDNSKFEYQNCDIHVKEYNLKLKHKKEENNDK